MFDVTTFILAKEFTTAIVNERAGKAVEIESASGKIDEEALKSLLESNSSLIKYEDKIFRLSRIENKNYKYINVLSNGDSQVVWMSEIDVNTETGDLQLKPLIVEGSPVAELREEFEEHKNDWNVHTSSEDRARWNNKVSAEVEKLSQEEGNYKLKLKTN